jgi:pilus assembly protein Flp/PilA
MRRGLAAFLADQSGATAVEYGLIAAMIAMAVLVGMGLTGNSLKTLFNTVANRATDVWDNAGTGG